MGPRRGRALLCLLLLRAAAWTSAQNFYCHKGEAVGVTEDPSTFNWTTSKVETCDNGALCQESVLLVQSGPTTAVLASKSCMAEATPAITFVQHAAPPGITVTSASHFCERSHCNHRASLPEPWYQAAPALNESETLQCPTCVALGICTNAPYLPCPNGTNRCYQGKLRITGGGVDTTIQVKGCTSITGCKLMSGIFTIGPMWVKEVCPYQSLAQPRNVENGANWLLISVGKLELLAAILAALTCSLFLRRYLS